jgi:2-polyprenyl-3-methyl-5-hydroxy-6-metoxy-1,4-benzoquinol methylase
MFTAEEWKLISLGAIEEVKQTVSSDRVEETQFLNKCISHLQSLDAFKKRYNFGEDVDLDFSPEHKNGFKVLDSRIKVLLDFIVKYNAKHVLDVGSRAGYLLFPGLNLGIIESAVGVEVETKFHLLCEKVKNYFDFKNVEFYNQMFEEFQTDKRFDAIVMSEVLEHIIDPEFALSKAKALLNPSGIIIITVPVDRMPVTQNEIDIALSWEQVEHVHLITQDKMKQMTFNVGLSIVEVLTLTGFFTVDIYVLRSV